MYEKLTINKHKKNLFIKKDIFYEFCSQAQSAREQ